MNACCVPDTPIISSYCTGAPGWLPRSGKAGDLEPVDLEPVDVHPDRCGCRFHALNTDTVLGVKDACFPNSVCTTVP